MSTLEGDTPCAACHSEENIVWFTDDMVWNAVCRPPGYTHDPILCLPCFIEKAERMGLRPTGWRLTPQWPWRYAEPPVLVTSEALMFAEQSIPWPDERPYEKTLSDDGGDLG